MTFTWDDSVLAEPRPEPPQPVPNADKSWVTTPAHYPGFRRGVFLVVCAVLGAAVIGTAAGLLFYDKGNTQNQGRLAACATSLSMGVGINGSWRNVVLTLAQADRQAVSQNYPASGLSITDAQNQIAQIEVSSAIQSSYSLVCQGKK